MALPVYKGNDQYVVFMTQPDGIGTEPAGNFCVIRNVLEESEYDEDSLFGPANILYGWYNSGTGDFYSYLTVRNWTTGYDYHARTGPSTPDTDTGFTPIQLFDDPNTIAALTELTTGYQCVYTLDGTSPFYDLLTITLKIEAITNAIRFSITVKNNEPSDTFDIGIRCLCDTRPSGVDDNPFREIYPTQDWTETLENWEPPDFQAFAIKPDVSDPDWTMYGTVNGNFGFSPAPTPPDAFGYNDITNPNGYDVAYNYLWIPDVGFSMDDACFYYMWGANSASPITLAPGEEVTKIFYLTDQFFGDQPTITCIDPDHGTKDGGTDVRINGTNFNQYSNVLFGSTSASAVAYHGPTQLTATSPAGTVGAVDIVVENIELTATLSGSFTYWSTGENLTLTDSNAAFPTDKSMIGAPVFVVDKTNHRVWKGNIASNTATTFTVSAWEPLFNTEKVRSPTGTVQYHIGHIFLYDLSPQYAFLNDHWEKDLRTFEMLHNNVPCANDFYVKLNLNHGATRTATYGDAISGDYTIFPTFKGFHRNFSVETAALVVQQLDIKEYNYGVVWKRGKENA
jgi:hypothetical protein